MQLDFKGIPLTSYPTPCFVSFNRATLPDYCKEGHSRRSLRRFPLPLRSSLRFVGCSISGVLKQGAESLSLAKNSRPQPRPTFLGSASPSFRVGTPWGWRFWQQRYALRIRCPFFERRPSGTLATQYSSLGEERAALEVCSHSEAVHARGCCSPFLTPGSNGSMTLLGSSPVTI